MTAPYIGHATVPGNTDLDLLWVNAANAVAQSNATASTLSIFITNHGIYNVFDYGAVGDGVTDDLPAFNLAIAAANAVGGGIITGPNNGLTYAFSAPVVLLANVSAQFYGQAVTTWRTKAGYAANYLVELRSGSRIQGVRLDGTNLPVPVGTWLGVTTPTGSLLTSDGSVTAADDISMVDCIFQNCPSGPTFFRQCNRVRIQNCQAITVQTHTGHLTNAVWEFYKCDDPRVTDSTVNGYNWKGYNLGNVNRGVVTRCHAYGGLQNVGHASFYEQFSADCSWVDCRHEGPGFGFKSNSSVRTNLVRFIGNGSVTHSYFQGSTDFNIQGGFAVLPVTSNQGCIIEGIGAWGPTSRGVISGLSIRRTVGGTTLNHTGITFMGDATYGVNDVVVRDCYFENCYIPVWTQHVAGAVFENLVVDSCRFVTPTTNSMLLYAKSIRVKHNRFDPPTDGASPPILMYSATSVPGTVWEVVDNWMQDLPVGISTALTIGADTLNFFGTKVETVIIRGNRTSGAALFMNMDLSNTAGGAGTNYIKELVIDGNVAHNLSAADAMTLTFGTVMQTRLRMVGNSILDASLNPKNVVLANVAQIKGAYFSGNDVNQITNWPPAASYDGFFGKIPVVQSAAVTAPPVPSAGYVSAEANATVNAVVSIIAVLHSFGFTA